MKKIVIASLALLTLIAFAGTTPADNMGQYQVFRVHNNTNRPIQYQVAWGNHGWFSYTVQPGTTNTHYWPRIQGQATPEPFWVYDNQHGAWSPVSHPASCPSSDTVNGGFPNSFISANDGRDVYVTWT